MEAESLALHLLQYDWSDSIKFGPKLCLQLLPPAVKKDLERLEPSYTGKPPARAA